MKKSAVLVLPALLFFFVEAGLALLVSSKTIVFYALSFVLWAAVALASALFLRFRFGRALAAVLPTAIFGVVVLLKLLPGRIRSPSNLVALGAAVVLFGIAAFVVHRTWTGPGRASTTVIPAAVFAGTSNAVSFFILPDLPVDRTGFQVLALFLAGFLLPLVLLGIGNRFAPRRSRLNSSRPGSFASAGTAAAALILTGAVPGLLGDFSPSPAEPAGAPNVVLIVMDTARRAELSIYGSPRPTTPRLAELARDGVVFDRAYANANWTIPAHACLLTGFLSSVTRTNFQSPEAGEIAPLTPDFPTAATILRGAGFRTASFPSNSYNLCRRFGFDQGFDDLWNGTPRDANLTAALLAHKLVRAPKAADWLTRHLPLDEYISAGALNSKIFRWLGRRARAPFFLFVNYTEPHGAKSLPRDIRRAFGVSEPPPAWQRDPLTGVPILDESSRASLLRWYDAELGALDAEIGRLVGRLKTAGLYDDTLVIVTSDHGELLGEHGDFGHVIWLYEPTIHIPLIVKYPRGEAGGTRSSRLVSHVDIFAEILARTGRPIPADIQGRPFDAPPQAVISENRSAFSAAWPARYPFRQTSIISLLSDGAKLIRSNPGREELFDLASDPDELHDLPDPALRAAVGRELDEYLGRLEGIARRYTEHFKKVKFDSLGYVK